MWPFLTPAQVLGTEPLAPTNIQEIDEVPYSAVAEALGYEFQPPQEQQTGNGTEGNVTTTVTATRTVPTGTTGSEIPSRSRTLTRGMRPPSEVAGSRNPDLDDAFPVSPSTAPSGSYVNVSLEGGTGR